MAVSYPRRMDVAEQTDRYLRLLESGDADEVTTMCADSFVFGKNNDAELDLTGFREHLARIYALGISVTYEAVRRVVATDAVVDEHIARMRHQDGREATGAACVVLRFDDDGIILRLDEYIDGRPFAPLFK
jgi:ketosteroid isomerase-like protein